jgi:hypothetical protein
MEVRTTDLYLSAYLLTHQINPQEVVSEGRHRKKVIFIFPETGKTRALASAYTNGQALINLADFRTHYEHARDLMFACLRSESV